MVGDKKIVFRRLPVETKGQRIRRINEMLPDGQLYTETEMTADGVKQIYGVDLAKNGDYGCEVKAHRGKDGIIVMDSIEYYRSSK